jgi:hypothetical protein
MRARVGIIAIVMSGLWVWASVLDGQGHNDDGFDRVPLFMEMREAARHEASLHARADYHAHEVAPRLASEASVNHRAAAD